MQMLFSPTPVDLDTLAVIRSWLFGVSWLIAGRQMCACQVRGECRDCREIVVRLLAELS